MLTSGLAKSKVVDLNALRFQVGDSANAQAARTVAEKSITLVKDSLRQIPLLADSAKVLSISVARRADLSAGNAFNTELRQRLGYRTDERVCIVAVGGSGVGAHLIRRVLQSYPLVRARIPELRMIVVIPLLPDQDGRVSLPPNLAGRQAALDEIHRAAPFCGALTPWISVSKRPTTATASSG